MGKHWNSLKIPFNYTFSSYQKIILLPTRNYYTILVSIDSSLFGWNERNGWYQVDGLSGGIISDMKYYYQLSNMKNGTKNLLYFSIIGSGIWYIDNCIEEFKVQDTTTTSASSYTTQSSSTTSSTGQSPTQTNAITNQDNPEQLKNTIFFIVPITIALFFVSIILLFCFIKSRSNSDNTYRDLINSSSYNSES